MPKPNPKYHIIILCFAVILRRMSDLEKPLVLRLLWGGADLRHTFSLQENETGDIIVSDKSYKLNLLESSVIILLILPSLFLISYAYTCGYFLPLYPVGTVDIELLRQKH